MVRAANKQDVPALIDICDRFNEQMRFETMGYPYSRKAVERNMPRVVEDKDHIALVHVDGGVINGFLLARIQDNSYFMDSYPVAYEISFHAEPGLNHIKRSKIMIALRTAGEAEMKRRGVNSFFVSTHPQVVGGMDTNLEKHGYRCISRYYVKELRHGIS